MEGFMEVELMVTKRDDDNRRPTDRVNIEQSALEDGMAEFCNYEAFAWHPFCPGSSGSSAGGDRIHWDEK